jgi:hypothetical protein
VKNLKKMSLQRLKKTVNEIRVVEVKRIFIIITFKKVPIQQRPSVTIHQVIELQKLI